MLGNFACFFVVFGFFFFFKLTFSKNISRNTIRVSNSLDPDQARRFVGPYIGPNTLQRLSAEDKNHHYITKTCLYNIDPYQPHFYIVKLGFTGVYIIFLISAQKHSLRVLVRTASAVLTSTHNLCFEQKYEKYQNFLSENFPLFGCKIFNIYSNRHVFVMSGGKS